MCFSMCDAPENTSIDDTHFWVCNCKKTFTHWVSRKYSYCLHVWRVWKNLLCGWHRTWRLCNVTGFRTALKAWYVAACTVQEEEGLTMVLWFCLLRKDKTCWQNCSEVQELSPSAGHQQLLFYSPVSFSSPANPTQPIYTCNNRQNVNNVGNLKSKSSQGSLLQISIQTFLIFLIEEMMMIMFFFSFTINNIDLLQWNAGADL
jgi:hypothetical protein